MLDIHGIKIDYSWQMPKNTCMHNKGRNVYITTPEMYLALLSDLPGLYFKDPYKLALECHPKDAVELMIAYAKWKVHLFIDNIQTT